jgi:hypothetical protein
LENSNFSKILYFLEIAGKIYLEKLDSCSKREKEENPFRKALPVQNPFPYIFFDFTKRRNQEKTWLYV